MPGMKAESKAEPQDALVTRWRETLAVHARTMVELDRALQPHGLGASDFEVLDVLADQVARDGGTYRVQQLMARVHLSQSALSRLLGRLERDGLVSRAMCSDDRRGVRVGLTEEGRKRHEAARPAHRAVLVRMLSSAN